MLLGLLAIGSSAPALAASDPTLGRFERLRDRDLRVATVAYRLSIANAGRCRPVLAPQLGVVLHSIEQYGAADRDDAARSFGLGRQIGVMAVVDGSPAQKAGLVAGDQLLTVNGRALKDGAAGDVPSRASADSAQQMIGEEMRRGPVVLRVSARGGDRDVRFQAEAGCPSNVELITGEEMNAWADGTRVMVSDGLVRQCVTDDDLALVIAHEMAHNLLHHRSRLAMGDTGSMAMRQTEEEADRLAVDLVTAAAFGLADAEAFMSGLLDRVGLATTHPDSGRRLALLRTAIADSRRGDNLAIRIRG